MQDIFGSVRRSLAFRTAAAPDDEEPPLGGALVHKINSCIRKSRVFSRPLPPAPPSPQISADNNPPAIRWRKGELIGCGAYGRVYMGMNLDSGELLAVKQVLIAASSASKEKAQTHIKELEEEVKLLKDLSHPNIVRYLGTVREEESLNILLEFVPGGSISSLLGKFGAFPESVIRTYTKQLLLGLEYLHKNGIIHRDIKGANILVDNKGCIKLADFGASKQVVELATISGAKSMKGTPYWMAPEVILQTGHNFSADIWSVGCTMIEMATGKPPWSQQYQEVAALFHIGTTKSHPPIPENLSIEAKDFLLKCLQKEPNARPSASELLQHPFVTGEPVDSLPLFCASAGGNSETPLSPCATNHMASLDCSTKLPETLSVDEKSCGMKSDDDMCQIDEDLAVAEVKSFNPMSEPFDDWRCKIDGSSELEQTGVDMETDQVSPDQSRSFERHKEFLFVSGSLLSEDDDELTESKIRAFLDEKALELKKLQTPLYEEFYNSLCASCSPNIVASTSEESATKFLKLPPKSRSPSRVPVNTGSPASHNRSILNVGNASEQASDDILPPPVNDCKGTVETQKEPSSPSVSFSERQRIWKEELDQELERQREMIRQAALGGKTSSPKDRVLNRHRERTRFASPGK